MSGVLPLGYLAQYRRVAKNNRESLSRSFCNLINRRTPLIPSGAPFASYLRAFTNPRAFLMFWTLGGEIPTVFAISAPDFPSCASVFTLARVAAVMTALLRFLANFFTLTPFALPQPRLSKRG